jgi:hypothetical protein
MTPHSMREMDALLAAGPAASSWDLVTRLAEDLPATELDALRGRLDAWPRSIRAMPERWWLQRLAGDDRPFHALASHYRPVLDGFVGLGWSGGCTVACSAGGRTVLLSGGFEPHHRGGDVFAWDTADRARRTLLSGKDYHGVTAVAAFTPDGATVVAVPSQELMLGTLTAWPVGGPGGDHRPRWRRQLGASVFDEDGEILEEFWTQSSNRSGSPSAVTAVSWPRPRPEPRLWWWVTGPARPSPRSATPRPERSHSTGPEPFWCTPSTALPS